MTIITKGYHPWDLHNINGVMEKRCPKCVSSEEVTGDVCEFCGYSPNGFASRRSLYERRFEDIIIDVCMQTDKQGIKIAPNAMALVKEFNDYLDNAERNATAGAYYLSPGSKTNEE